MALWGEFDSPTNSELEDLLNLAGARVEILAKLKKFTSEDAVLVADTIDVAEREMIGRRSNLRPVMSNWILDSIASFSLREMDKYFDDEQQE